jgi:hypothetical protein
LNAGDSAAGGASGEKGCIAGLEAVAVVGVFAGDAIGELIEVSLAGEDCSVIKQALRDAGVCCCRWMELGIIT